MVTRVINILTYLILLWIAISQTKMPIQSKMLLIRLLSRLDVLFLHFTLGNRGNKGYDPFLWIIIWKAICKKKMFVTIALRKCQCQFNPTFYWDRIYRDSRLVTGPINMMNHFSTYSLILISQKKMSMPI